MTIAPHADAVHRLVDRLDPGQVEALYVILEGMVGGEEGAGESESEAADVSRSHRFSFIGVMNGEPDLARRSAHILRDELGDPAA